MSPTTDDSTHRRKPSMPFARTYSNSEAEQWVWMAASVSVIHTETDITFLTEQRWMAVPRESGSRARSPCASGHWRLRNISLFMRKQSISVLVFSWPFSLKVYSSVTWDKRTPSFYLTESSIFVTGNNWTWSHIVSPQRLSGHSSTDYPPAAVRSTDFP